MFRHRSGFSREFGLALPGCSRLKPLQKVSDLVGNPVRSIKCTYSKYSWSYSLICLCSLTGTAIFLRMRIFSISTVTEKAIAK